MPDDYIFSGVANPIEHEIEVLKHMDDDENCYIIYKNKSEKKNFFESEFLEIFLLIPLKDYEETKTLVIFLTNVNFYNENNNINFNLGEIFDLNFKNIKLPNSLIIPYFIVQKLKQERLMILANLREFIVNFNIFEVDSVINSIPNIKNLQISKSTIKNEIEIKKNNLNSLPKDKLENISRIGSLTNIDFYNTNQNKNIINNLLNENNLSYNNENESFYEAYSEVGDELSISNRETRVKNKILIKLNPESIITNGKKIPLESRLRNYYRCPQGGIECRSHDELHAQDGIILEIMKRAGKQLLEGKNVIGLSLPVKIFEPRSTLTRLTDIWGTAYENLNKAAEITNPVERMKMFITMGISGLHMNARQSKPFNPILGETYEGYWPDNSKIYMEHVSHHPPISRFFINSSSKLWRFHGFYEYVAKIKSITGNVVGGQFKGPNIIEIYNKKTGIYDIIQYSLPTMNITGMMYGKRIIEWEGVLEFKDEINNIYAFMKFTPAPKFYQKFVEPTDIFRGELTQNEVIIHKIYGSPIDKLMFDDEVFWELEKCDLIKPMEPLKCLPSDCRYREDMNSLARGDIEFADREKVRLEIIQRADRTLRAKFSKNKGH